MIFDSIQSIMQYHQDYASKPTTHQDPTIVQNRTQILTYYKQQMLKLSAMADILQRLEGDMHLSDQYE